MSKVFSDIQRSDWRSKHYSEPSFTYLDESARDEAVGVRAMIEEWFAHYPSEQRDRLLKRFRSTDETTHLSGFFELYLHELARRFGYDTRVNECDGSDTRHPDFEIIGESGSVFLEATLVTEASLLPMKVLRMKDRFVDEMNRRVASPDFFLHLHESGIPSSTPPSKKLAAELQGWVETLDPEDALRVHREKGFAALPSYRVQHDGWRMHFVAQAWRPASRGKPGLPVIGSRGGGGGPIDRVGAIRKSVKKKARRYGELGRPYLVAVNVCHEFSVDETEFDDALLSGTKVRGSGDAVWVGPTGPRNRGLSSVIAACNLNPWNVAKQGLVLYENPWSRQPYSGPFQSLSVRAIGSGSLLETSPGIHPREVFEVPADGSE